MSNTSPVQWLTLYCGLVVTPYPRFFILFISPRFISQCPRLTIPLRVRHRANISPSSASVPCFLFPIPPPWNFCFGNQPRLPVSFIPPHISDHRHDPAHLFRLKLPDHGTRQILSTLPPVQVVALCTPYLRFLRSPVYHSALGSVSHPHPRARPPSSMIQSIANH